MTSPADSQAQRCYYAEKGVIGCVMIDEQCFDVALEMVKPQDFFNRNAELIFGAMKTLREQNTPINVATILMLIGNDDSFRQNDGLGYLTTSSTEIGHANALPHFCKIVRSESIHRRLLAFADAVKAKDWATVDDADSEVARLEDELSTMADTTAVAPWSRFSDIATDVLTDLMSPDPSCYVKTGFCDLDDKFQLAPETLTILAARPAIGKSALAINIMTHIAFNLKLPVVYFSLEMSMKEVIKRVISSTANVNGNAFKTKRMNDAEWQRVLGMLERFKSADMFIDSTANIDISTLRERVGRIQRQHGLMCVIVDYLQLMNADGKRVNTREQEVSKISRGLKVIAKDFKIPVIALSQLSRNVENRADKHPVLADLRESGAIEQDADNVLFLHREKEEGKEQYADLDIAKQRNGPMTRIKLFWNSQITKFTCMDESFQ